MCSGRGVPGISTTFSGKSGMSAKPSPFLLSRILTYKAFFAGYGWKGDQAWTGKGGVVNAPLLVLADPVREQERPNVDDEDQEKPSEEARQRDPIRLLQQGKCGHHGFTPPMLSPAGQVSGVISCSNVTQL